MTYDASKNTIPKDLGNLFVPNALWSGVIMQKIKDTCNIYVIILWKLIIIKNCL
jgi:hypothetical protein